jgi:RIO kinase 1
VSLERLLEDGVIDEALGRLKSGKEADVWLVRHGDEVLCAKVYKDRQFRSFKNNTGYKEGRAVRNTRTQRAMDRGSRFGQAAAEEAWKSAESDALHALHAQGVRVPAPVLFYEGILLMKLALDAEGHPAPRLIDAKVTREQAGPLYSDLRAQAVKMLCCDLIHGDLSPYNVLLSADGPTLIDFPQVVSAAHNSTAEAFFKRDVENLRRFFAGFDPALESRAGDAAEIWRAYVRRELTPDFVPSGRPPPPEAHHPRHGQSGQRSQHPHGPGPPRQGQQHPRPQGQQHARPQGAPHPRAQGQQHARPQGQQHPPRQGQQHPPRPQGQQHPPRPQGQQHPPRPQGQQHPPRPHGTPHPRPHGQQPAPQQGHARPPQQGHARPPRHGRAPGQQQQRPRPQHQQRPAQQQPPRPSERPAPVVERVHHPVPQSRPPHK